MPLQQLVGACALCLPALESAACEFLLSAIAEGLKFESDDLGPLYRTLVAAVVDLSKRYQRHLSV